MAHLTMYQGVSWGVFRPGILSALRMTLLVAFLLPRPLHAAPGDLDPTFGGGGKVITDFGGDDTLFTLALQPDGKTVVAGSSFVYGSGTGGSFALARYNVDGSLDATFGTGGKVITDFRSNGTDVAHALAIQPDGKIVAAGVVPHGLDFGLARYNVDVSLDATFGTGGKVISSSANYDTLSAAVLQSDGKIVVAGSRGYYPAARDFVLARYNTDGSLDASFGSGGEVTTDFGNHTDDQASAMALQPDGKILVGGGSGGRFALARYNPDGTLDPTFGTEGTVITAFGGGESAAALALQPDGKIVVAGGPRSANFVLARYNPDGRLDLPFGTGGVVATGFGGSAQATALGLQEDGKIVVAGRSFFASDTRFVLARYEGGSSEGAPFLRLNLNQSSFVPGETLRAGIVEANYGKEIMVDKYFGALLPPGTGPARGCPADDAIVFLTTRTVLSCLSASPQTFEPVARNLLLPAEFPALSTPNFYSVVWPSNVPTGAYLFFIAFTRAGTVDILALATMSANLSVESPQAPSGLTATALCRTVTLRWQDRSSGENAFRIERRSEGGSFVEIATVGPGVTSYQDSGLTPGVAYTYRVRAYRGALYSTYSNEAAVTGGPEPPQAPTNLTGTAVSSGNILNWQDNSGNESGFTIEHYQFERGWVEIARVGPNITSYKHGFNLGLHFLPIAFSYQVRAFNGSCPSNYSNTSFVRR